MERWKDLIEAVIIQMEGRKEGDLSGTGGLF